MELFETQWSQMEVNPMGDQHQNWNQDGANRDWHWLQHNDVSHCQHII